MPRELPERPSLEKLKKLAKSLTRNRDPKLCLREAQHELAQDYGFKSWKELRDFVLKKGDHSYLHVHCGDSSANALRSYSIPGEVMVWREIYIEGPVPGDVNRREFCEARARYLSNFGLDYEGVLRSTEDRYQRFAKASDEFEEIVLWFDACMFDQTIMVHVIDQLKDGVSASLICVSDRGLGEYPADEMAALLPTRQPITAQQKRVAHNAWVAFTSYNPRDIETFLQTDTSALPHVGQALRRHLEEFPSTHNGLSRMQRQALQVVADGDSKLGEIFMKATALEEQAYMGDASMWGVLDGLASARQPLLQIKGPHGIIQPIDQPLKEIRRWDVSITGAGKRVLAGDADHIELNGIDRWLGGVHLHDEKAEWRWDSANSMLVPLTRPGARHSHNAPQDNRTERNVRDDGTMTPDYFKARHGFGGGLHEEVDLREVDGFDQAETVDDLAELASRVPNAIGFAAPTLFGRSNEYRDAKALLWYTVLSPTGGSWPVYLFDQEQAQKLPASAPPEAALAAAEAKIISNMEEAERLIAAGGSQGVLLDGHDHYTDKAMALAIMRQGGSFRHKGQFGTEKCGGCRSLVPGGEQKRCGHGVEDIPHWNCCGGTTEDSLCAYWELMKALDDSGREDTLDAD